jgi:hypothetical protein
MKTKLLLLTIFVQLLISKSSFSQSWLWAKNAMDGFDYSASIKRDRLDNIVTVSGPKFVNTTTYSNQIVKLDRFGNVLWKKIILSQPYTIGGLFSGVRSHAFDHDGNIYLLSTNVRQYDNTIFTVTDTAHNLIKLSPGGDLIWRKKMTSQEFAQSNLVSDGNSGLIMNFQTRATTYQLLDSTYNFPAGNTSRMFISKIDTAGKVKWSKICLTKTTYTYFLPPSTTVNAANILNNRISVNDNGYILIGGVFYDSLNVLGTILIAPPITPPQVRKSGFLFLLDSNGQRQWSKLVPLADERNLIPDVELLPNKHGVYQLRNIFQTITIPPSGSTVVYNDTLVFIDNLGNKTRQVNLRPATSDHFEMNEMDSKGYAVYVTGRQFTTTIVNPFNDTTYMQLRRYDTSGMITWNKSLPAIAKPQSFCWRSHSLPGLMQYLLPEVLIHLQTANAYLTMIQYSLLLMHLLPLLFPPGILLTSFQVECLLI